MKVEVIGDDGHVYKDRAFIGRPRALQVRTADNVKIEVPDPIRVRVTSDLWEVDLTIRPDPVTLAPAIDDVGRIRRLGDRPIPNDILRSLGMGRILEEVVRQQCIRYEKVGNRWVGRPFNDPSSAELRSVLKPPRPRQVPQAEVEKAAEQYRAALAEGRRDATMAVAEALSLSRPTAARRIQKAREQGLLGPIVGTKAGEAT